jgi:hypothetical protein
VQAEHRAVLAAKPTGDRFMRIDKKLIFGMSLALAAGVSYTTGAIGADQAGMTPSGAIAWEPFFGGPLQIAKLWGDRDQGAYGMLLKMPAGFEAGSHAHTSDYHAINVQGTWVHTMDGQTKELPVGSYVMQPGMQFHNDSCKGPGECILFIQQDAKGDFIPAEKK